MIKISQNDDHSVLFDEEDGRKWRRRTGKWWFVITATFLKNFSKPGRYAAKSTFRLFTLALHLQLVLQFWLNVELLSKIEQSWKQLLGYTTFIFHLDYTTWQCLWLCFSLPLVVLPLHLVRVYKIHFKEGLKTFCTQFATYLFQELVHWTKLIALDLSIKRYQGYP